MNKNVVYLLLLFFIKLNAQEKLGIVNSNYSSTNSIYLNPSSSVDSKTYMQLNIVGVNASVFNNIAYLPWFSVWKLKRNSGQVEFPIQNTSKLKKFVTVNAGVDGPAFVISKRRYGAGIFVRARSVTEVKKLPYELTNFFINNNSNEGFSEGQIINLKNIRASSMSWVEYGLNFGIILKQSEKTMINIGANLKYITGINIFYANLYELNGVYKDSAFNMDVKGKLRYNNPGWNSGKGLGADLGITYKKMLKKVDSYYAHSIRSNCQSIDYKFKAALSLRDFGCVRFTRGTNKADINSTGLIFKAIDTTNRNFESKATLDTRPGTILATLPTNIVGQFDWNFENHLYLNTTIIKNVVPNKITGVQGSNLLSICPRYEFRQFEVAMPLTFQKFLYPKLGFAFRIRSFVLGFDNVFPLLFMTPKTYGGGIYFNFAISIFKNSACRKSQRAVYCPPKKMKSKGSSSTKNSWKKLRKMK